jgi:hypothetical protein
MSAKPAPPARENFLQNQFVVSNNRIAAEIEILSSGSSVELAKPLVRHRSPWQGGQQNPPINISSHNSAKIVRLLSHDRRA